MQFPNDEFLRPDDGDFYFMKLSEQEYYEELDKIFSQKSFCINNKPSDSKQLICTNCQKEFTKENLMDYGVSIIGAKSQYPYLIIDCSCQKKIEVRPKYSC